MMQLILFVLLSYAHCGHGVVLDKNQLESWYPNYLTSPSFDLASRQINSISNGTFNGLNQLQELNLDNNQLNYLDPSIFNGLSQLERLYLYGNQLNSAKKEMANLGI
jgi:Leucine-rich repeat (LRR) protein